MKRSRLRPLAAAVLVALGAAGTAQGGAFLFSEGGVFGNPPDPDFVTHPIGYRVNSGRPGQFTVNVCVLPGKPNSGQMATAIANAVDIFNGNVPVSRNLRNDEAFASPQPIDFESVAIHELGHCLGLAHVNAASESGLSGEPSEATKSGAGNNAVLDINPGADGLFGSADDQRGDDVNLHYFEPGVNDPFRILRGVDSGNFTRDVAQLPPGDSYVANADRAVGDLPRFDPEDDRDPCRDLSGSNFFRPGDECQESIMNQGSGTLEYQRALAPGDVAMFAYARTGLDRVAGTADDYQPTLAFLGVTDSPDCDINLSFDNAQTGFAVCQTGFNSGQASYNPGRSAIALTSADAFFNTNTNWRFSNVRIPLAAPDQATVAADGETRPPGSLLDNDIPQHGGGLIASPETFGGPEHGTVVIAADGSFTYTSADPTATEDFFVYEVCADVDNASGVPACSYQLVELTLDPDAGQRIFADGFEPGP